MGERLSLKEAILLSIGAAGFIAVAAVAPNALSLLGTYERHKRRTDPKYYLSRTLKTLIERKLVQPAIHNGHKVFRLTPKGEDQLQLLQLRQSAVSKPKRWDGKYRVIIFDISENRRRTREKMRRELITLGFLRIQDSVWLYPYDCAELVTLLKSHFRIGKDVLHMVVETLENDRWVKEYFNLK